MLDPVFDWIGREYTHAKRDGLFWSMLVAFLVGLLAALIYRGILASASLPTDEAREWVSALAGWVGGAGALLAAALTLPTLRAQAAEAKRQTDFAVGDASPEIEITRGDWQNGNVAFRIVNWNRRPISAVRLYVVSDFGLSIGKISQSTPNFIGDQTWQEFSISESFPDPEIRGWQDRARPPSAITGMAWINEIVFDEEFNWIDISLGLVFEMDGKEHHVTGKAKVQTFAR